MFRKKTNSFAPGYPSTNGVKAKKLKSGCLMLVNGTNAFNIQALEHYSEIQVKDGEQGSKDIVGTLHNGKGSVVLARFGSMEGAVGGHAALIKAHSGLSISGMGLTTKVVLTLLGVWLVSGALTAPGSSAIASVPVSTVVAAAPFAPSQPTTAAAPLPPSLDDLANGGYQFAPPKLQMPNVQAPTLNCAPVN